MQLQVAFQLCAFELPSPCSQTGRDCERQAQRRPKEIEIGDRCEDGLFAPDRQDLEDGAGYKQRYWKMNEDRMLSVSLEERGLYIERVRGRRKQQVHNALKTDSYFSTTIVPVILG